MSQMTWRLFLSSPEDGPMNMAVDQAIMEAVAAGLVPPTLRLYAWQPACLSLGYTQAVADVDRDRLKTHGWDLVRRLTGGRAILHTDELTYSVALQASDPIVAGDIVQSYRRLSQALLEGMRTLGADVEADKRLDSHAAAKGPVCFEVPSHYEITVNGKKLVGSAQVRKFGGVLQHGSLPLTGDITRICDALVFEGEDERESARQRVASRACTLETATGVLVTWEHAAAVLAESFQHVFDLRLIAGALTNEEQARAQHLRAQHYAAETWNARF